VTLVQFPAVSYPELYKEHIEDEATCRQEQVDKRNEQMGCEQAKHPMDQVIEGGFGGQEDLEDRYATTSGEH